MKKKPAKTTYQLLDEFRQKGAAWQATDAADRMEANLRGRLEADERQALAIARQHHKLGEGSAEFYDIVGKLISKYRQMPLHSLKKTLL